MNNSRFRFLDYLVEFNSNDYLSLSNVKDINEYEYLDSDDIKVIDLFVDENIGAAETLELNSGELKMFCLLLVKGLKDKQNYIDAMNKYEKTIKTQEYLENMVDNLSNKLDTLKNMKNKIKNEILQKD
jgi:hypothetical protein